MSAITAAQQGKPVKENPDWTPEPLLLNFLQVAIILGVSKRTVVNLVDRGELVRRKIGARSLIPRTSVEAFCRKDHATGQHRPKKIGK